MKALSKRGKKAATTVLRSDMEISFEAQDNAYHPTLNPKGVFPLNIAENKLMWKMLKKKLNSIGAEEIPDWAMGYTSPLGSMEFREAIARFYKKFLVKADVNPNHLACSPGATGVVEMTAFLLADEGDVAAFPAPSYPVYRQDIGNISGVLRYDIITHKDPQELKQGLLLKVKHLENAQKEIASNGRKLKLVVLTSPDNPTGQTYDEQTLQTIAKWCHKNKVHLIFNEIYGLSRININHPDLAQDYPSVAQEPCYGQLMESMNSDYLHHWYSFSKDFGISGFRVGIVYSQNEAFIKAYENLNLTHSVSNHTQWLIQEMVSDTKFIKRFIKKNQKSLTESYVTAVKVLRKLNINYVPAQGSLFLWIDLSPYLTAQSKEAEEALWMDIFEQSGVLLTPGDGFGHQGFGYFRMVYPYVSNKDLKIAMKRFAKYFKCLKDKL